MEVQVFIGFKLAVAVAVEENGSGREPDQLPVEEAGEVFDRIAVGFGGCGDDGEASWFEDAVEVIEGPLYRGRDVFEDFAGDYEIEGFEFGCVGDIESGAAMIGGVYLVEALG